GRDPAVDGVIAVTGGQRGATNTAMMFGTLKPIEERRMSADQVIGRIRAKTAKIPGATLFLQPVQDLRIGGRASSAQYQYTLQSDTFDELTEWAPKIQNALRRIPGVVDVTSDQQNRGLQASLQIDRTTASRLGVTPKVLDDTLYDAFGQRQVSTMYTPLNQYHVVMEVEPKYWQNPDGLRHIQARSTNGSLIPLASFTRYETSMNPLLVSHSGQFPSVTVSFSLIPGMALSDAVRDITAAVDALRPPSTLRRDFSGTAQAFQSSLSNQPLLIAAALLTVYIVLGILYESLIHPITILSTLPSAGVGALLALLLTGNDLS